MAYWAASDYYLAAALLYSGLVSGLVQVGSLLAVEPLYGNNTSIGPCCDLLGWLSSVWDWQGHASLLLMESLSFANSWLAADNILNI